MILYSSRLDSPEVRDGMTVRLNNQLRNAGYRTIGEICVSTESELMKTRNFGKRCLEDLKRYLAKNDLRIGMSREELREVPEDVKEAIDTLADVLKIYRTIASDLSRCVSNLSEIERELKAKFLM